MLGTSATKITDSSLGTLCKGTNQKPTALDVLEGSYETYYVDNAKQPANHAAATHPKWNQAVFPTTRD